jgi:hypothetical protein
MAYPVGFFIRLVKLGFKGEIKNGDGTSFPTDSIGFKTGI